MRDFVVVTCEHAVNRIPREHAQLFRGCARLLDSHRGYDAGALVMARELAASLGAPLVTATVSRLLVDHNRSLSNFRVWSERTRSLPPAEKQRIIERYYAPYHGVTAIIDNAVASGRRVIHISSHSFTPVLNGTCAPPMSASCTTLPGRKKRCSPRIGSCNRRTRPGLARASQLSVCRQGRWPDTDPAPAVSADPLCRYRARAQSGFRAGRR